MDYFAAFALCRRLDAAALPRRFEALAMPCRRFLKAVPSFRVFLRFARRLFDLRGDGLTFRATVPRVEPIDRAAVVRKSSSFAAGLRAVIFIVISWTDHKSVLLRRRVLGFPIGLLSNFLCLADPVFCPVYTLLDAPGQLLTGPDDGVHAGFGAREKIVASVFPRSRSKQHSESGADAKPHCN
jgi:hypothetical protein